MSARARWIRLGLVEPLELRAAYTGLAEAQPRRAAPILLWAQAKFDTLIGLARAEEHHYVLALIVPRHLAPGRRARWRAWALAPVIAAYRQFGLRAYQRGEEIWLDGRRIAQSGAGAIGECVVAASSLLDAFPAPRGDAGRAARAGEFRAWLREGTALARSEWTGRGEPPAQRQLEAVLRGRFEAQHGWQFETSWPTAAERAAIRGARAALAGQRAEAIAS